MKIEDIRNQIKALHDEAAALNEASYSRDLTEEETAAQAERMAKLEKLAASYDASVKLAKYAIDEGKAVEPKPTADQVAVEAHKAKAEVKADYSREDYAAAVSYALANGHAKAEYATITTTTATGTLLPKAVAKPITPIAVSVLREAHQIYGLSVYETEGTGEEVIPVLGATKGSIIGETGGMTENTPGVKGIKLTCKDYQSGAQFWSKLTVHAQTWDVTTEVQPALDYSVEQAVDAQFVTAAAADTAITSVELDDDTSVTFYDSLVEINRALKKKYNRLKVIVLSEAKYRAAEKMKGTDGHPILNRDPQNQELLRFNGTPVLYSDELDTQSKIGFVFSLAGVRLRDVPSKSEIEVYRESSKPGQIGFNLVKYVGMGWDSDAVREIVAAA